MRSTAERVKLVAHHLLENSKNMVASAMAGVEPSLWILGLQSLRKSGEFFFCLVSVEQMESSDYGMNWPRTSSQNVLQTAMCTARKQQNIDVQSQFVSKIIVYVVTLRILHKQMLIPFGHRMFLWNMSDNMKTIRNLTGLINHLEPLFISLWPLRSDAMKISSLGKELATHRIWRDNHLRLSIMFNKMPQTSRMVAMSMRDKHIIHRTEVDIEPFSISDEYIAGTRIEQNPMMLCLQQD